MGEVDVSFWETGGATSRLTAGSAKVESSVGLPLTYWAQRDLKGACLDAIQNLTGGIGYSHDDDFRATEPALGPLNLIGNSGVLPGHI